MVDDDVCCHLQAVYFWGGKQDYAQVASDYDSFYFLLEIPNLCVPSNVRFFCLF
jgi:hypothetical protein